MTDQPNPVELTKEISGHPTDHSRKARLVLCKHCHQPIAPCEGGNCDLGGKDWVHVEPGVANTDSIHMCLKHPLSFAEPPAPSLPEEGGQPRNAREFWIKGGSYRVKGWMKEDFSDMTVAELDSVFAFAESYHKAQEAGASTLGQKEK